MIKQICRITLVSSVLTVFTVFNSSVACQDIVFGDQAKSGLFTARVKQFGEFATRFNNSSDFSGNPADSLFLARMPREKMMMTLFNLKDPRIISRNSLYSAEFVNTKDAFIREVVSKNITLDRYSPGIIAEAKSKVIINGEPLPVSIFLNQEIEHKGIKWVILSVKGLPGDVFREDTAMVRFIQPTSNETDFINLKRALGDKGFIHHYAFSGFKPDDLSIFFYCLNTGIAKYEYTEEVIYHIVSIPGWYFKVKDFNRNELNSGWLISDISRGSFSIDNFR